MVDAGKILLQALISEKATTLQEQGNCYVFRVATTANKLQIKQAVEQAFHVKVKNVSTTNIMGKNKKMGRFEGKRSDWKKAFVWLKPDNKIELFETV
jgi:large subunit ribosomal protein L23